MTFILGITFRYIWVIAVKISIRIEWKQRTWNFTALRGYGLFSLSLELVVQRTIKDDPRSALVNWSSCWWCSRGWYSQVINERKKNPLQPLWTPFNRGRLYFFLLDSNHFSVYSFWFFHFFSCCFHNKTHKNNTNYIYMRMEKISLEKKKQKISQCNIFAANVMFILFHIC